MGTYTSSGRAGLPSTKNFRESLCESMGMGSTECQVLSAMRGKTFLQLTTQHSLLFSLRRLKHVHRLPPFRVSFVRGVDEEVGLFDGFLCGVGVEAIIRRFVSVEQVVRELA